MSIDHIFEHKIKVEVKLKHGLIIECVVSYMTGRFNVFNPDSNYNAVIFLMHGV